MWNIQVCYVTSKIPSQPQQFDLSGKLKHITVYYQKWVYRQNEKVKSQIISSDPVYSPTESSTWLVCQEKHLSVSPLSGQSQDVNNRGMTELYLHIPIYCSRQKAVKSMVHISCSSQRNKSVPPVSSQIPSEDGHDNSQHLLNPEGLHLFEATP